MVVEIKTNAAMMPVARRKGYSFSDFENSRALTFIDNPRKHHSAKLDFFSTRTLLTAIGASREQTDRLSIVISHPSGEELT